MFATFTFEQLAIIVSPRCSSLAALGAKDDIGAEREVPVHQGCRPGRSQRARGLVGADATMPPAVDQSTARLVARRLSPQGCSRTSAAIESSDLMAWGGRVPSCATPQ